MQIDVFTLFPDAFAWFRSQRHVTNATARGTELGFVNYRDHTQLSGGQWVGPAVRSQNGGQDTYLGIYFWNSVRITFATVLVVVP